jgi:hypothetical protein
MLCNLLEKSVTKKKTHSKKWYIGEDDLKATSGIPCHPPHEPELTSCDSKIHMTTNHLAA